MNVIWYPPSRVIVFLKSHGAAVTLQANCRVRCVLDRRCSTVRLEHGLSSLKMECVACVFDVARFVKRGRVKVSGRIPVHLETPRSALSRRVRETDTKRWSREQF